MCIFRFSKKHHLVCFLSLLNYGDIGSVLIKHLQIVIPLSYPCYYTNLCPHKPHKPAHTHTHTHTHLPMHTNYCEYYTYFILPWTVCNMLLWIWYYNSLSLSLSHTHTFNCLVFGLHWLQNNIFFSILRPERYINFSWVLEIRRLLHFSCCKVFSLFSDVFLFQYILNKSKIK